MSSIDNLKIDTNCGVITIMLHTDIELDLDLLALCADECWNYENISSDNINEHSYVYCSSDSEITMTAITDDTCLTSSQEMSHYKLIVSNPDICYLDTNIKYFKLMIIELVDGEYADYGTFFADYLYYDPQIIYQAEISTIHKYCQACLDDHNMQLIVYVTFKRQLLENAVELQDYEMALSLYVELCRVLGIVLDQSVGNQVITSSNNDCTTDSSNNVCITCTNGLCSISKR